MLRTLLAKDLRRARRNPLPWLINLIVPLCVTAVIGMAFGGKSDTGALGRIRFAVVDEDDSLLTRFLRGAVNQGEGAKYLDPVFLDRTNALRQIVENDLSAVLIIPTNFTRHYLTGKAPVNLELVKNPAQSIHPAVLEELSGVVVTALNALARNFQSEFPEWQKLSDSNGDYRQVAALIERGGARLEAARRFLDPPLVGYEYETRATEKKPGSAKSPAGGNIFGFLLVGMVGMFLLFLASTAMADLHRELQGRTFERYHTLQHRLLPFMAGKIVFAVVILLLSSLMMLGGGALIFRIHWQQPLALAALVLGYAGFAAGLMAVLVAMVPDERRASNLNTIAGMILGMAGGCCFPPEQMPAFLRDHLTPLLPSHWFVSTVRQLDWNSHTPWLPVTFKLVALSALLIGLAVVLFRRRFKAGLRA